MLPRRLPEADFVEGLECDEVGQFLLGLLDALSHVREFGQHRRKLGPGGTNTLWKIFGLLIALIGLLNLTGDLTTILRGIIGFFSQN